MKHGGGYWITVATLIFVFAVTFHFLNKQRQAVAPLKDEGNTLTSVSLIARAYAQYNDGEWPALASTGNPFRLSPEVPPLGYTISSRFDHKTTGSVDALLLGRINNAKAYTLRSMAETVKGYFYLGYAVSNESELLALTVAVKQSAAHGGELPAPAGAGTLGLDRFFRLHGNLAETMAREGAGEKFIASARRIPVLIEKPKDGWSWVYFLDLHAERLPYPGEFPLTENCTKALAEAER